MSLWSRFKRGLSTGRVVEGELNSILNGLAKIDFAKEPEKYEYLAIVTVARNMVRALDEKLEG